jgi:ATP-dependent DNA ligase
MAKNRRIRQKAKIEKQHQQAEKKRDLFKSPGHFRRDARRLIDIIAFDSVPPEVADNLIRKLHFMGNQTQHVRELTSVVNSLSRLARVELEEKKMKFVQNMHEFPMPPMIAQQDNSDKKDEDGDANLPSVGYLEVCTEEELLKTLHELKAAGVIDSLEQRAGIIDSNDELAE